MSIKIKLASFDDLTPEQQENQPNNGCGKEEADYLVVEMNGETYVYSSAMEPEDVRFSRDLDWVASALRDAYNAGFLAVQKRAISS